MAIYFIFLSIMFAWSGHFVKLFFFFFFSDVGVETFILKTNLKNKKIKSNITIKYYSLY